MSAVDLGDVGRSRSLLALYDVKLDPFTFIQRPEPTPLDRGMMNEAVLLTVITCDETKPLTRVEPLHGSLNRHLPNSFGLFDARRGATLLHRSII
jgi:hypothetical protein